MAKKRRKKSSFGVCLFLMLCIFALFAYIIWDGIKTGNGLESSASEISSSSASSQSSGSATVETDDPYLILVNGENPLPDGYESTLSLSSVQGEYELEKTAAQKGAEMISAAAKDGVDLLVCSAYRSVEKQQQLFEAQIQQWMNQGYDRTQAEEKAATVVAVPGYSEHHTGLCMDIVTPEYQVLDESYAQTEAAKWLAEHAHEYGYILRYPKDKEGVTGIIYEPWHYRYVGTQAAEAIYTRQICLEEYLSGADVQGEKTDEKI